MLKRCSRCNEDKPEEKFRWKNKEKGWRQPYCVPCNKEYQREHYRKNKSDYKQKARAWDKEHKKSLYENVYNILSNNSCVDCGESDPRVLEFDHINGNKDRSISRMINDKVSWGVIQSEIKKCEVRCKNCHAIVTYERAGSVRSNWI